MPTQVGRDVGKMLRPTADHAPFDAEHGGTVAAKNARLYLAAFAAPMITDHTHSTLLITGGAGFVGSSIALHWKVRHPKSDVIAFDNLKRRGSELNLARLKDAGIRFVHGDVRNTDDLMALPRIDAMVECSAEPSVMAGYGGGARYVVDTNLLGTVNCLELLARDKADLVFLSTSRVYPMAPLNDSMALHDGRFVVHREQPGLSARGLNEDFTLTGARSLYGSTKLASELLITEYAQLHGLRTVVDRCGVIAGPWQMGKTDQGFVLLWLARHHWNLPLSYTGFGGVGAQVRDVLHVADLCDLVTHQLENMPSQHGATYNAGGGAANSAAMHEFTALAQRITGNRIDVGNDPQDRPGDIKWYVTDNSRLTAATGWEPRRTLEDVFSDSYAWLKQHDAALRVIMA